MAQPLEPHQMQDVIVRRLKEVNMRFKQAGDSTPEILKALKHASNVLSEIVQEPGERIIQAMMPCMSGLVHPQLMKHENKEIQLFVAVCLTEIIRIVAPEAPYSDELLRKIFALIVSMFKRLNDITSPYFEKVLFILEMVANVRSCVVMLDLNCDDLILEMFETFFSTAREEPSNMLSAMKTIICLVFEEIDDNEDIVKPLLNVLLNNLPREKKEMYAANHLAKHVCEECASRLGTWIVQFTGNSKDGLFHKSWGKDGRDDIVWAIYRCSPKLFYELCKEPKLLFPILPKLLNELMADESDSRLKAVTALSQTFERGITDEFKTAFKEFIKRFTDKSVEVRLAIVDCVKGFLVAHPEGDEALDVLGALSDRLQDYDDVVRGHAVAAICELAISSPKLVSQDILRRVGDRLFDKEESVRQETLQHLIKVHRTFCLEWSKGSAMELDSFSWIPSKIIRYCFDKGCKEFRAQALEWIFCEELFPSSLSAKEWVECWIAVFTAFEKTDIKALEGVLIQKQRFQIEMKNYLSARQKPKEKSLENQNKLLSFCKVIAASFMDTDNAEKKFQKFNHLKDTFILGHLEALLDPCTSFDKSLYLRDTLLEKLGKKHQLYDFIKLLAIKCSYILFGKDHMKALLGEIEEIRLKGSKKSLEASVNLLAVFASRFPALLDGKEGEILLLLNEENECVKEGAVQVLSKLDGTVRGQLTEESNSADMLTKLCIEGSRKQAKYAVQALVGVSNDSGTTVLSALYRRLLDILETSAHLPSVLQSLGCIAQHAISIFETREEELVNFLVQDLFRRESPQIEDEAPTVSDIACLKVCGLKALVKSFLPSKDGHRGQRIKGLFGILGKILECGDVSDEARSSDLDKAYFRLAAAKGVLRLSKRWDSHITPELFKSTVFFSRDTSEEYGSQFLTKVHQLLKDRALPHKYACVFALNISDDSGNLADEATQYLSEFIENSQREGQLKQIASLEAPEYVLVYLVYILSQETAFPSLSEQDSSLEALLPYVRQLYFFIWMLIGKECKDPDSASRIFTIFRTIKHAEDVVDPSKTANAYVLCDIGIIITKGLLVALPSSDQTLHAHVILPAALYKPIETMDQSSLKEDGSHLPVCFKEEDVLSRVKFSLPHKNDETCQISANSRKKLDEVVVPEDAEVTLKPWRSNDQEDVEMAVLDMISPGNNTPLSPKRKRSRTSRDTWDIPAVKSKQAQLDEAPSSVISDKRKRSRSKKGKIDTLKAVTDSDVSLAKNHDVLRNLEPEKAVNDANNATKRPVRLTIKQLKPPQEAEEVPKKIEEIAGKIMSSEGKKRESRRVIKTKGKAEQEAIGPEPKSPSTPRRAIRKLSLSGLESPNPKSVEKEKLLNEELIGFRIKVWWPMDKQFYNGTVESYNASTKKHKVVYDDGDVENLKLAKEQWEHLNSEEEEQNVHDKLAGPSPKVQPNNQTSKSATAVSKEDAKRSGSSKRKGRLSVPKSQRGLKAGKSSPDKPLEGNDEMKIDSDTQVQKPESEMVPEEDIKTPRRSAKKTPSRSDVKRSSKKSKQEDSLEVLVNVMHVADDGKESDDDMPLDVWKMSKRKGH